MNTSFFTQDELVAIGFKKFGKNVFISKKASLYNPENMTVGNNVRIDDFCIISGKVAIGSYVHISAYTALYGRFGITIEDYSGLSPRCTVFSAVDDFSGDYLIGPMVEESKTNLLTGTVHIKKYSQIGAGSIIFPGIIIGEGVATGAFSLIKENLNPWAIYAGIPVKKIRDRGKKLLQLL